MSGISIAVLGCSASGDSGGGGAAPPPSGTATFTPVAGTYTRAEYDVVTYTITASTSVTWTWTNSGDTPSSSPSSGGAGTSITFTMYPRNAAGTDRVTTVSLSADGKSWTLNLTALYSGAGTGGTI